MTEGLFYYILGSGVFIMVTHFAIHIRREFSVWMLIGIFALGGALGYMMDSMILGFLFAMVCTFLLW